MYAKRVTYSHMDTYDLISNTTNMFSTMNSNTQNIVLPVYHLDLCLCKQIVSQYDYSCFSLISLVSFQTKRWVNTNNQYIVTVQFQTFSFRHHNIDTLYVLSPVGLTEKMNVVQQWEFS